MNDVSGALRTVLTIFDVWLVPTKNRAALLGCDHRTYDQLAETRELNSASSDTVVRLSYILGIWKALQILFPDKRAADTWINRPNGSPEFGGQTPLAVMAQGDIDGLRRVRQFLDGWCE
jgi:uncharacterized protein (DUF2384 family)